MNKMQKCEATVNSLRVDGLAMERSGKIGDNELSVQNCNGNKIISQHMIRWNKKTLNYDVK